MMMQSGGLNLIRRRASRRLVIRLLALTILAYLRAPHRRGIRTQDLIEMAGGQEHLLPRLLV